jgi:hypothetical protein
MLKNSWLIFITFHKILSNTTILQYRVEKVKNWPKSSTSFMVLFDQLPTTVLILAICVPKSLDSIGNIFKRWSQLWQCLSKLRDVEIWSKSLVPFAVLFAWPSSTPQIHVIYVLKMLVGINDIFKRCVWFYWCFLKAKYV